RSSLGSAAELVRPTGPLDLAGGKALYLKHCATCHGPTGKGDGPAAAALPPPKPPAIGTHATMAAVSTETMFRKVRVGVGGTAMPSFETTMTPDETWNVVAYLISVRADSGAVSEGEGLYAQSCVACHGVLGRGDGETARRLSRSPPDIGSLAWQATRTDSGLA